jgi:uncharacterized coiled-coil protein SlyX
MKRKKIPYGTKVPVRLTNQQRDLIRDHTFYPGDLLNLALAEGTGIRVELTLDDIEEIQGYVAAEANHCENLKLKKQLDALFQKFHGLQDSYDDQED